MPGIPPFGGHLSPNAVLPRLGLHLSSSVRASMAAKAKLRAPAPPFSGVKGRLKPAALSDRQTKSLEAEVEAHEKRIDEAVFTLYGVQGLPK